MAFSYSLCGMPWVGCHRWDALGGAEPESTLNSLEEDATSNAAHFGYIEKPQIYCDRLAIDYFKVVWVFFFFHPGCPQTWM